jgi:hypothetical protein
MYGLDWLDRRKTVDIVEDRGILHAVERIFLEHEREQ